MKKLGKKLISAFISIAMLASTVVPFTAMAKETDGYYIKLEETDATGNVGFNEKYTHDAFSKTGVRKLGQSSAPSADGYYMEFEVEIPKTDDYRVWAHGGRSGVDWSSVTNLVVDGTTISAFANGDVTTWNAKTSYGVGIDHAMTYQYVDTKLTKGTHTIRYMINELRPKGGYYLGALDFMLLVPSEYTWTPSITELPVAPVKNYKDFHADGYAWLQESDYSAKEGFTGTSTNSAYSDGKAYTMVTESAPGAKGYYVDYYLNVPESGEYEIWVHGSVPNEWASNTKIKVNGELADLAKVNEQGWDGNYVYGWKKATVNLEKGNLDLRFLVDESRAGGATCYIAVLDMICIVPTSYEWTQSITDKPVKPVVATPTPEPEKDYIPFHEDGYLWLEETDKGHSNGFSDVKSHDTFSGGKLALLGVQTAPGADGFFLDFYVDVPANGNYKIWTFGGYGNYASVAKIKIDGETEYALGGATGAIWGNNASAGISAGINCQLAYQYADVTLTEGGHTIRYYVIDKPTSNADWYVGALDFMLIMPADYTWTPSKTERPTKPAEPEKVYKQFNEEGYLCLEAETDYSEKHSGWNNTLTDGNHTNLISGSGWGVSQGSAPGAKGYNIDFDIDVPEAGSYDIWVYGGRIIYDYVSAAKIRIDGTEINPQLAHHSRDDWGKQSGSHINLGWSKATVTLAEGGQTLSYYVDTVIPGNNASYVGALDLIYIVPSDYGYAPEGTGKTAAKPVKPAEVEAVTTAWIEGEDSFGGNISEKDANSLYSAGYAKRINTPNAPATEDGYYSEYKVKLAEGTYDIYFRASDNDFNAEWMSNATAYVDGEELAYTKVIGEEWTGTGGFAFGWLKVSGVEVEEANHTIRWAYKTSRTSGSNQWIGILDAIAIVPAGSAFAPVSRDIAATKGDFAMCTLLAGVDLDNVTTNIELPETLADGTVVTWKSNNTDVITDDGKVTRIGKDTTVKLTATAGSVSKEFAVTVPAIEEWEISNFVIDGTVAAGQTVTATAKIKHNFGSGDINLILAIYDEDDQLIDMDICEKTPGAVEVDFDCKVEIDENEVSDLYAKAFIWTDFSELRPIISGISTLD